MSRSFKKKPYHSVCSSHGDKYCRKQYHRENRQKNKRLCKELEGTVDKDLLYYNDYFLYTKNGVQPEEKFINKSIDYSLRFADKWSWASDGGNYYWGGLENCRREFDEIIFGARCAYASYKSPWEEYKDHVELVFNKDKPLYTIVLKRIVVKKVNYGFYMPWVSKFAGERKEEKKYITTEIYPPNYKPEEDWEVTDWWKRKNRYFNLSNWDLFGFMFKSGIIPLYFKNEEQLMNWLRNNEETIVKKWLKAKLLRK